MDNKRQEVYAEYEGDTTPLDNIVDVVHRLGYEAIIKKIDTDNKK